MTADGHGSYSNMMAAEILRERRCSNCRNLLSAIGGGKPMHLCFLTFEETKTNDTCNAWHQKNKWKGRQR